MAGTIFNDINFQGITNAGLVAALGTLKFTFTSSGLDATTFQDSELLIANTNPIVLSSSGKADVFLLNGTYDIVLKDSDDVVIKSITDFTIDSQGIGAQVLANTAAIEVNRLAIIDNKAYTNRAVYSPYDEFTAVGGETTVTTTNNTELELYKNGTLLILTTDYTVNGDGLTIDLVAPLALNDLVTWYRLARSFNPLRRKDLSILITPTTDVDYTLTAIENQYGRIEIDTTNWTIARNIIMNKAEHTFLAVVNNTGSEAATFKNTTGTGISVGTGEAKELRNDTVNVRLFEGSAAGGGASGVRQIVRASSVDSSGQPNYITIGTGLSVNIAATTTSIIIHSSIADSADDRTGSVTSDTTISSLADATINYLFADVAAGGGVTLGATTLQPTYQFGGTFSVTSGQATFNIAEMTMKVGNGATADQTFRVFIGEAVTAGGVVTSVVNYALNGLFRSANTAIPALATQTNFNDNLGTNERECTAYLECTTNDQGYVIGNIIEAKSAANGSNSPGQFCFQNDTNSSKTITGSVATGIQAAGATTGGIINLVAASWQQFIISKRIF